MDVNRTSRRLITSPPPGPAFGDPSIPISSPPSDFNPDIIAQYENADNEDIEIEDIDTSDPKRVVKTRQKLRKVLKCLHDLHWSFQQFVNAWVKDEDRFDFPEFPRYRTPLKRRRVLKTTLDTLPSSAMTRFNLIQLRSYGVELDGLMDNELFGKFDHTREIRDIDLKRSSQVLQDHAPIWYEMLVSMLNNQRSNWRSYGGGQQDLNGPIYLITSVVCHHRAKKRSNFLQYALDIYLMGCGVKRRVIETLAGLGLCHSYTTGLRLDAAAQRQKAIMPTPANS